MATASETQLPRGLFATVLLIGILADSTFIAFELAKIFIGLVADIWASMPVPRRAQMKAVLESNFSTALLGSLAGAVGGAYAAQRIAERATIRKDLERQMHLANVAISIAYQVFNAYFALKRQHVKELCDEYFDERKKFLSGSLPITGLQQTFKANLGILPVPILPLQELQNVVLRELSIIGRPLIMTSTLLQSVHQLSEVIVERNELIGTFKKTYSGAGKSIPPEIFFGTTNRGQHVDATYLNLMEGLQSLTDTLLFFSHRICEDLMKFARMKADDFERQFGRKRPKITTVHFGSIAKSDLYPDDPAFDSWDKNFPDA